MSKNSYVRMNGLSDIGPNVPAFLVKLWKLVNDPETDELICWSESGMSFIINQPALFARDLLSLYYKHNNMASFIRQLNMYGFHKIVSEIGGLKNEKDSMEFAHQCFIKDHPYLLENIKRKLPNTKAGPIPNEQFTTNTNVKNGTQSEILAKILSDVNNLKGKQEAWDARLASMKRENEALWRELAIFRQKHLKQEQIINRLIHFIVTIVQPSRNVPLRRRYPLMLSDIQPVKKITKLSGADTANLNQGSPTGPTIHEIDTTDVILGSPEQSESSSNDVEFERSDLSNSTPAFLKIEQKNRLIRPKKKKLKGKDSIPEDWLEVRMDEGDSIDPLTPINPADVNPAVAAATMKHFEGSSNVNPPIAITIPSVVTSTDSGKKKVTEKKVIYLTDLNKTEKPLKKYMKKPAVLKLDVSQKSLNDDVDELKSPSSSSSDFLLDLNGQTKSTGHPTATTTKRKISVTSPSVIMSPQSVTSPGVIVSPQSVTSPGVIMSPPSLTSPTSIMSPLSITSPVSTRRPRKRPPKKASSISHTSELDLDDLEYILTAKQTDDVPVDSGDYLEASRSPSIDSFLKLDSLYNGTISEDQLNTSDQSPLGLDLNEADGLNSQDENNIESSQSRVDSDTLNLKEEVDNKDDILNLEPGSMAIVCQQSPNSDNLARIRSRDLSSHVDSVQGELDYLKEMLKGEGYNFDANNLPWLFNDDPLSYGVLPSVEDENNRKKNEETTGNELMAYGSPNLMDLVDMIGSTPNSQDWVNILSPTSPTNSELVTPAPSPSAFSFPSSNKRRKI